MTTSSDGPSARRGDLTLGHVLGAARLDPAEVLVVRHTYRADGLSHPQGATVDAVREYTRAQDVKGGKFPRSPPSLWLVFMADGKRRSRFLTAYENHGEDVGERTATGRFYDLHPSEALAALRDRLVIEWSADTINWAKGGAAAAQMPVVEIADPARVAFPGFDRVLLTHDQLTAVVEDPRYDEWRTALAVVQGIYLIADTSTGKLYVGKADGSERLLGRWTAYARDGHGGNLALRELAEADVAHSRHFLFSILRVFGPATPVAEVDEAEAHFKRALLTRQHGLNRN
ncbi:GIY-YIG nuclease family protein [Modestobacter sp. VKM Ac-2986]|uniref:GIY-YIG nuclease family protein n=1 Tax=Modestobacter sp. VKM Ac-2986 TaxID=3004140 RepID=UPI0022AB6FDE|nr:GIY-YIG nuclease family protein [Modestobacter sp. VKM Ac-2986]MCZ2830912.1 GIY-YIG nuclease family protein [Modestobacter sp. VKM Ac-2986]